MNQSVDKLLNRPVPISEANARIIDEARRALMARATGNPMAPEPDRLDMTTREIHIPRGEYPIEVYYLSVTFEKDSPRSRAMIADYLRHRLTPHVRPRRLDRHSTWRYEINHIFKMDFDSMLITIASVQAMGPISDIRVEGLFENGLFVIETNQTGKHSFKLCGDRSEEPPASTDPAV